MTLWTLISWVIMIQNGPDWVISSKYNTCRPKHQAMVQEDGLDNFYCRAPTRNMHMKEWQQCLTTNGSVCWICTSAYTSDREDYKDIPAETPVHQSTLGRNYK